MIFLDDPSDQRIDPYRNVRDRDLAGRGGRFVAEGKVVVDVLLRSPYFRFESLFLLANRLDLMAETIDALPPNVPVYVAERSLMDQIVGFPIHRGILAIGKRHGADTAADDLETHLTRVRDRKGLVIGLIGLANHDNMGAIFRNAAAFSVDAILLDETCCDPLYRKALRVSVGAALLVPFARCGSGAEMLDILERFQIDSFATSPSARTGLDTLPSTHEAASAILFGSEGPGLPDSIIERTTGLRIEMQDGFDSLNVGNASAIVLHRFYTDRLRRPKS